MPGAIEMMDHLSIRAAEGATDAGYPVDAGAALVVELDGSEAECEARFEHVIELCAGGATRPRRPGRGRARADLARAQGGLRGDGPDRAELLRAGQRDPAHAPRRGAGKIDELGHGARPSGGQRLPRRRRQPAPARLLRRRAARRGRARRGAGRADREGLRRRGRVDHRRARRRRRQEALHAVDVRRARPRHVPAPALRVRPRRAGQPGQGDADAAALRRGARALPAAPARAGRAWRSASDGRGARRPPPATSSPRRSSAAAEGGTPVRFRGGGTKLGWARPRRPRRSSCRPPGSTGSSSTTPATSPRCSRPACRWRDAQARSPRPARCSRSTRPTAARPSAAWWPPATPARCATATAARATSSSA